MKGKNRITASSTYPILGIYEGEVLNTNITNKNGLDITREVMETVFESEDYQQGIENGWFIGFLGHPEDPNCMEFEHGCIVMTDGYIDDNGKVYGKFNLIDTPVGQIVKKFQDAGVTFGISIRGAGDIIHNSVEPDSFVFRGFDLVSFPAYPESIPTFAAIAASTNLNARKNYQAVCAAVQENLCAIQSCSTIDVLESQFAKQSPEYKALENQRKKITKNKTLSIDREKVEAMTELYLQTANEAAHLAKEAEQAKRSQATIISAYNRKIAALKRITAAQANDLSDRLDSVTASCQILRKEAKTLQEENKGLSNRLKTVQKTNLIYKQRVTASTDELQEQKTRIIGLQRELRKTVTASSRVESISSNLDEENCRLHEEIQACIETLRSYQAAYINVYASALGVNPDSVIYNDTTSVSELQRRISNATNTANLPSTGIVEPVYIEEDDGELVTL